MTTLAEYFGLDTEALQEHLEWLKECSIDDNYTEKDLMKSQEQVGQDN